MQNMATIGYGSSVMMYREHGRRSRKSDLENDKPEWDCSVGQ